MEPCEVCFGINDSLSKVWDSESRKFLMMCPECVRSLAKAIDPDPDLVTAF